MSQIIGRTSTGGQAESDKKELGLGNHTLQMPYPEELYKKSKRNTLPSNVAIPVGLAQVFIGVSMVICGSMALRYRSYLFYYGTGLWAGTISGITGALVVMATKEGLPKPRWLCGGKKWQIHVLIGATMLALTASVLMSIFSTSGLMQDTMHPVGVDLGTPTRDEETFERRKSSGVIINAILLLLAMLEILLSFCSLGIGLRVLCRSTSNSSLFSADSAGSEVTIHDILGSGPEYEARKDRLLRWLGHQRRNFFMNPSYAQPQIQTVQQHQLKSVLPSPNISSSTISGRKRGGTHLVALKPPQLLIPHLPQGHPLPPPRPVFYHHRTDTRPYAYPVMVPVPLCPAPVRRSITPMSDGLKTKRRRKDQRSGGGGSGGRGSHGSMSSGSKGSKRSSRSTNQRRQMRPKPTEVKVQEMTEEEIGRTYTGLDRVLAENFISNSMDKY